MKYLYKNYRSFIISFKKEDWIEILYLIFCVYIPLLFILYFIVFLYILPILYYIIFFLIKILLIFLNLLSKY
jgi:hypothetical protein